MSAKGHLRHDEFFAKLGELFQDRKGGDHGAIYLSQKRMMNDSEDSSMPTADDASPDSYPPGPLPILVRASNNKGKRDRTGKVKLSTVVSPDQLDSFYSRYADVCKTGMAALKPRDRSKKKAKAKKKKTAV